MFGIVGWSGKQGIQIGKNNGAFFTIYLRNTNGEWNSRKMSNYSLKLILFGKTLNEKGRCTKVKFRFRTKHF
jgi:hypothetical protein